MNSLVMMCGLPASGKSTFARNYAKLFDMRVLESDEYRSRLCPGDYSKSASAIVFSSIQRDALTLLRKGVSVLIDSTSLSDKNRISMLGAVDNLNLNIKKVAHVILTPFNECLIRDSKREKMVGESVLTNMRKNFTMPQYREGFDNIFLNYDNVLAYSEFYDLNHVVDLMDGFNQENPHHTKTLGEHCWFVHELLLPDKFMSRVGLLHDFGKLFTKTFVGERGQPLPHASYYGHENVGSYESTFILNEHTSLTDDKIIRACGLIQYHMRPYGFRGSVKAEQKFLNLVGPEMYADVMLLHNADKLSK